MITPQNIYELYSVTTDPKRVSPHLSPQTASEICRALMESSRLEKIYPRHGSPEGVMRVAEELSLRGPEVFDCVLAVTAHENGVEIIYTENTRVFERLGLLRAENPLREDRIRKMSN